MNFRNAKEQTAVYIGVTGGQWGTYVPGQQETVCKQYEAYKIFATRTQQHDVVKKYVKFRK